MAVSMPLPPVPVATCFHRMFLELKSFMNPSGKDFMDFRLISVLPWEALWDIETNESSDWTVTPSGNTINRVSGWLQKHGQRLSQGSFHWFPFNCRGGCASSCFLLVIWLLCTKVTQFRTRKIIYLYILHNPAFECSMFNSWVSNYVF